MTTKCAHCGCNCELTTGVEIYPHRDDLGYLHFWICRNCDAYVGCHKNGDGQKALGTAANAELRSLRGKLHAIIDPKWRCGSQKRSTVYSQLTQLAVNNKIIPKDSCYHTAELNTEQAREMLALLKRASK